MNIFKKNILLFAVVAAVLLFGLGWAGSLSAMTNEEFLDLCAGGDGPGDADAIKRAIDGGADVNFVGPEGVTPLMVFVAAHSDRDWQAVASVRALLKAGARVNARSKEGATALSYAVLHKAGPRIVSTLIQHGAEVNLGVEAGGGVTPLMIAASADPCPLVSALLLAAGARTDTVAKKDGRTITLSEIAQKNPEARVRRFIDAAVQRTGRRETGLPLFADVPADQELRKSIQDLDARIRALIGPDNWLGWLAYIKWQTELDGQVELRRAILGNDVRRAWLNEYEYYLETLAENGDPAAAGKPDRARVVAQGRQPAGPGSATDLTALKNREIVVLRQPGRGTLAAYETATGRELWRYTPSALSEVHLLGRSDGGAGPLVLAASHWGERFGDAAVLDPVSGEVLLELPPLDDPKWTLGADGRLLAVSTDYSLTLFDLETREVTRKSWYDLLESRPWAEARTLAREEQNKILAVRGLALDAEGRFVKNNAHLFQSDPGPDPRRLRQAREALQAHNYYQLDALAVEPRGLRDPGFVLGPACLGDCPPEALATPLFLVNRRQNRIDCLMIDNDPARLLTRGTLGWGRNADGRLRPRIEFSPGGTTLAVTDAGGDVHFFAVADGGRYLGRLAGQTVLDPASGRQVKDCRLAALLDDDLSGRPFCAFDIPGFETGADLIVEAALAEGRISKAFSPRPGRTLGLTAFAASPDDQWAAGLEGGALWRINPAEAAVDRVAVPEGLRWTALAFSGDGRRLAAAAGDGALYVSEPGQPVRRLALGMKNITHLAVDREGNFAWAAAEGYGPEKAGAAAGAPLRPALALVDLSGQARPVYRPASGPIVSLAFHPEAGYAVAVEDQPAPDQNTPVELKAMETIRWAQGRADIVKFDHLRAGNEEGKGLYDPEKAFVGLSPDLSTLIYQELRPSRAFVTLGRETVGGRETGEMESAAYQAWLGQAVFSRDRRLALLPERGRGEPDDGAWPFHAGGAFYLYDLASGREVSRMSDRARHPGGLIGGAFTRQSSRAVTAGRDGSLRLWELGGSRPVNILTWVFLESGAWVVLDADGRFDTPDPDGLDGLHWTVTGPGGSQTVPLDAFLEDFYQPRLAGYVLAGRPLPRLAPVAARDLTRPAVKVVDISPEKDRSGRVAVTVEITGPADSQVRDLKLYRDGRMVVRQASGDEPAIQLTGGRFQTTFHHQALPSGQNQAVFSAGVLTRDRLRSLSPRASVKYRFNNQAGPRLHLVAVGVGQFDNPAWNLDSAAGDALGFASTLPRHFAGLKAEVSTLAGGDRAKPTKANLRATLKGLASGWSAERRTGSGPDDVVVLTISSRGLTVDPAPSSPASVSSGPRFYFLPSDVPGQDQAVTPDLLAHAVSSAELASWLAPLEAGEIILIVDARPPDAASQSAEGEAVAAPVFDPGPMGDRTLGLLAYDKGMRLLCAASDSLATVEYGQLKRGLLNHALLADGLEKNGAAPRPGQNFSLQDWLNFGLGQSTRPPQAASSSAPGAPVPIPSSNPRPLLFDFGGISRPLLKPQG